MKKIKPILLNDKEIIKIAKEIIKYFKSELFLPIVGIYKDNFKKNIKLNDLDNEAINIITKAIKENNIVYDGGYFKGNFNSLLSKQFIKIGATFEKGKGWKLKEIPYELKTIFYEKEKEVFNCCLDIENFLNDFSNNLNDSVKFNLDGLSFIDIMSDYEKQFLNNFSIKADINQERMKNIDKEYTNNLKKYINSFLPNEIKRLREQFKNYVFNKGYNNTKLAEIIKKEFNVSQSKAVFLARQESSLLLSSYSKSKYLDNGLKRFEWQTSGDEKVRNSHKHLDGKIFYFDNPPVINTDTGERGLPGEDYNCRCVMIPIIE